MSMFDEAKSLQVMMKMRGLSQGEVAKMLGTSQSYVANKLRLLGLDEELQNKITAAGLTERHARALLRLDGNVRADALEKICERRLTVRESESLVDFMNTHNLANKIGGADRLRAIDVFLDGMKNSLASLCAIGVTSSQKISYFGNKMIITISNENG